MILLQDQQISTTSIRINCSKDRTPQQNKLSVESSLSIFQLNQLHNISIDRNINNNHSEQKLPTEWRKMTRQHQHNEIEGSYEHE